MAIARLVQLQKKFMANPEFALAYQKKIRDLHTLNFTEIVDDNTELGNITHYLAHK